MKTTNKNSLKSKQKLLRKCGPFWLHIWFLLQCYTLNLRSLSLQTGFFEENILSWTDEISEEWLSGVNRFSTNIMHLFPRPPLNNFQTLCWLCSPWLYCATQISVTTSVTIVLPWSHSQLPAHLVFRVSPSLQAQIRGYWHCHCKHLTVLNWNIGGKSKMFVLLRVPCQDYFQL